MCAMGAWRRLGADSGVAKRTDTTVRAGERPGPLSTHTWVAPGNSRTMSRRFSFESSASADFSCKG